MQRLEHIQQLPCRAAGIKQFPGRNIALERLAQLSVDGAGVQRHDDRPVILARPLDRQVADHHVERRLGRAIAVPAAQPVVRNAANPGGEGGESENFLAVHQRQEIFGDQRRPDRIHLIILQEPVCIELAQAFFRSPLVMVEQAGGDEQHRGRDMAVLDPLRRIANACFRCQVDPNRAALRPGKANDAGKAAIQFQLVGDCRANPAIGAEDDRGFSRHERRKRKLFSVLLSLSNR